MTIPKFALNWMPKSRIKGFVCICALAALVYDATGIGAVGSFFSDTIDRQAMLDAAVTSLCTTQECTPLDRLELKAKLFLQNPAAHVQGVPGSVTLRTDGNTTLEVYGDGQGDWEIPNPQDCACSN